MKQLEKPLLLVVLLIAIFFRFYHLAFVPPSPSVDEVSTGYNAFSILKTGRDEYGNFLPLVLRAYDDWQPVLYTYLTLPFVYLFGLNLFAVRFPSAILSILTVLTVFFIAKALFAQRKKKSMSWFHTSVFATLLVFLLAISPWHIYVSRLGLPTNTGFSFFIFALYFFLRKRSFLSVIFFVLSFMSYHADKIFIPVFVLGLIVIYWRELLLQKQKVIVAIILGFILLFPFLKTAPSSSSLVRFKATSTLKLSAHWEQNQQRERFFRRAIKNNDIIGVVQHSQKFFFMRVVVEGYLSHFRASWLFLNSGDEPHKAPNFGLLYHWTAPFIAVGFISFLIGSFSRKTKQLIFFWFFTAPLAGAITTDAPHALRLFTMLPTWEMFAALGILRLYSLIRSAIGKTAYAVVLCLVVLLSLPLFFVSYFTILPKVQSQSFQFPLSDAILFVLEHEKSYNKIVFSNQGQLYQSYMFFLYHSKYDPAMYLKEGGTKSGGFAEIHRLGKYEFRPIDWRKEARDEGILYVGRVQDFPSELYDRYPIDIIKQIHALDGNPEILIVKSHLKAEK